MPPSPLALVPPMLPSTVQGTRTHRVLLGLTSRVSCRETAAYLREELKKYVPKGYRVTILKHCVLQKVHRGDVHVINDNFISSRRYFYFLSLKTLILLVMLATLCVAKGRSPSEVTCPSSVVCRGHATHFREGEPKWSHPVLTEAGHALPEKGREFYLHMESAMQPESKDIPVCRTSLDKKYRNLPYICRVSFYAISHFIYSGCLVIYSLTCASCCHFHPRRKHQLLPNP